MKHFRLIPILAVLFLGAMFSSCENETVEFPDFDYSTVYFAYQYPVRTIVLGEDIVDNSLDNEHKCKIYATMGGVYDNTRKIDIDIVADNSLCDNLFFEDGSSVQAMPSNYYALASNQISLDGEMQGGVEVQLTDAFFADPSALGKTYVIPLLMTSVADADSILSGIPKFDGAARTSVTDWDVQPKDFTLYAIKYINPWHGYYLRRGTDVVTEAGASSTMVRHAQYVENDELVSMTTSSLNSVEYPVTVLTPENNNASCTLLLSFNNENQCTITSATEGFTVSGSGTFVEDGEKNSWGDKDRNAIYLDYTIEMTGKTYETKDTLVVRDRGVSIETFSPTYTLN